jgi:hypothetical protein
VFISAQRAIGFVCDIRKSLQTTVHLNPGQHGVGRFWTPDYDHGHGALHREEGYARLQCKALIHIKPNFRSCENNIVVYQRVSRLAAS